MACAHACDSEEESDMVRRRVNAIMEATPMHLITAYFEHAYEISGPEVDYPLEHLEASLAAPYFPSDPEISTSAPAASSFCDGQEDAASVMKRVEWMTGSDGVLSQEKSTPASFLSYLPGPSLDEFEDASDILARANMWVESTAQVEPPSSVVETQGDAGEEDVASILARAQSMASRYMTTSSQFTPLPSAIFASSVHPTDHLHASPSCAPASHSAGNQDDVTTILRRVDELMSAGPRPAVALPSYLTHTEEQEDAASILARVQRMADTLATFTSRPRTYTRRDTQSHTQTDMSQAATDHAGVQAVGWAGALKPQEDAAEVLQRVNDMMHQAHVQQTPPVSANSGTPQAPTLEKSKELVGAEEASSVLARVAAWGQQREDAHLYQQALDNDGVVSSSCSPIAPASKCGATSQVVAGR